LDATNLLAQYRPELATTEEQLATKGTEIADLSAELNAFIGAHGEDSFDYEARMAEHKAVIAAIDEAIAEMNGLVGSVAGEGIHDNSERISAETAVGAFAQIKALSKLASKADQGAVAKIVALLEDIKGNLEASVADENQGQVMAEEDYNALKSAIEATLADLTLAQTNLTNKKADLEGKIATQETRLAENEEALRVATEALAAKTRQCDEWETKYNNDKAKRIEELDIVQQCRAIFTDESMQFSKFLSDRVEY
jgi:septal ring factor EnvC (AmiA/AmiB activator)